MDLNLSNLVLAKKKQTIRLKRDINTIIYMKNISININNNCHLFKNNVHYAWAKVMQASKMYRKLINISFSNFNLIYIKE